MDALVTETGTEGRTAGKSVSINRDNLTAQRATFPGRRMRCVQYISVWEDIFPLSPTFVSVADQNESGSASLRRGALLI